MAHLYCSLRSPEVRDVGAVAAAGGARAARAPSDIERQVGGE